LALSADRQEYDLNPNQQESDVTTHISVGLGHSVDLKGLQLGGEFPVKALIGDWRPSAATLFALHYWAGSADHFSESRGS
jgi:hypothetical protein